MNKSTPFHIWYLTSHGILLSLEMLRDKDRHDAKIKSLSTLTPAQLILPPQKHSVSLPAGISQVQCRL